MKTQEMQVTQTLYIWAIPPKKDGDNITYEISHFNYYHRITGSVCLHGAEVTMTLPAGIDLFEKAIDTLEAERGEIVREFTAKLAKMDEQIQRMYLLTGPVTGAVIDEEL